MVKQESFKKRVRARMETTGERYAAARAELLAAAKRHQPGERVWASEPEAGDGSVRDATGKGWNEWCDTIEAWPGHTDGHPAIAKWLEEENGLDGWWSQQVTGGFERIVGWRMPYQRPDGTFTASKSKTVSIDAAKLRAALLSDAARRDLFPGQKVELRSKPEAKAIRLGFDEGRQGVALMSLTAADTGDRCTITVAHEKLVAYDDVERWKFYWGDWLDALG